MSMWKPQWGEAWWRLELHWCQLGNKELPSCAHLPGISWWVRFWQCGQDRRWEPCDDQGSLSVLSVREQPSLCLGFAFPASLQDDLPLSTAQIPRGSVKMALSLAFCIPVNLWRWRCGGWAEGWPDRCTTCGTNARGTHNLFCEHLGYRQAWWQCWPGSDGGHSSLWSISFEHPCLLRVLLNPNTAVIPSQTGSHDPLGQFHAPVGFGTAAWSKRVVKPLVTHWHPPVCVVQGSPTFVLPKSGGGLCSLCAGWWQCHRRARVAVAEQGQLPARPSITSDGPCGTVT